MVTEGHKLFVRWMDKNRLTYRAAAKVVGRSAPTVYWWAAGKITPDTSSAVRLKDVLGIPVEAWTKKAR